MTEKVQSVQASCQLVRGIRLYQPEDGRVVKLRDDLIRATRYALMCQRHAKTLTRDGFNRRIEYPPNGIV